MENRISSEGQWMTFERVSTAGLCKCSCGHNIGVFKTSIDDHVMYVLRCDKCGMLLGPSESQYDLMVRWQMMYNLADMFFNDEEEDEEDDEDLGSESGEEVENEDMGPVDMFEIYSPK